MDHQEYIQMGLEGKEPLKIILCGAVQEEGEEKIGVVSVVFATQDREKEKEKIQELREQHPENYYMVYSVPLESDLTTQNHYPSIAIRKEDLQ